MSSYSRSIELIEGPFGAVVHGIDLDGADHLILREVAQLLYQHRVLLLPAQSLTVERYGMLGTRWGNPIMIVGRTDERRVAHVASITNDPATPTELRDPATHWHQDNTYEADPSSVTMLYGIESPAAGSETLFADTVASYETLPDDVKREIAHLEVVHDPNGGLLTEGEWRPRTAIDLPLVRHRLVQRHPVLGVLCLYGFSGTASTIVGMEPASAEALLLRIKAHAVDERFRKAIRMEPGDVMWWDNYGVAHRATPVVYSAADDERRLVYRMSFRGLPSALATPG